MRAPNFRNESYEAKKLEAMYNNLLVNFNNHQPKDYEIRVDDFVVIERNNDPARFMSYADYITPETKYISVFLYKNNNQSDKYFFHLQPNHYTQSNSFNGLGMVGMGIAESEQQQKERWRKEMHYEQLLKENEELKRELEKYEEAIQAIEDEKEEIKSNRDISFEKAAGFLFSGVIKSDFVKKNIPFLSGLSGVETEPEPEQAEQSTFKRKGDHEEEVEVEEAQSEVIDEEDRGYVQFVKDIKNRVGEVELANIMFLLDLITTNPHAIPFTLKQVNNYLKQNPKTHEKV